MGKKRSQCLTNVSLSSSSFTSDNCAVQSQDTGSILNISLQSNLSDLCENLSSKRFRFNNSQNSSKENDGLSSENLNSNCHSNERRVTTNFENININKDTNNGSCQSEPIALPSTSNYSYNLNNYFRHYNNNFETNNYIKPSSFHENETEFLQDLKLPVNYFEEQGNTSISLTFESPVRSTTSGKLDISIYENVSNNLNNKEMNKENFNISDSLIEFASKDSIVSSSESVSNISIRSESEPNNNCIDNHLCETVSTTSQLDIIFSDDSTEISSINLTKEENKEADCSSNFSFISDATEPLVTDAMLNSSLPNETRIENKNNSFNSFITIMSEKTETASNESSTDKSLLEVSLMTEKNNLSHSICTSVTSDKLNISLPQSNDDLTNIDLESMVNDNLNVSSNIFNIELVTGDTLLNESNKEIENNLISLSNQNILLTSLNLNTLSLNAINDAASVASGVLINDHDELNRSSSISVHSEKSSKETNKIKKRIYTGIDTIAQNELLVYRGPCYRNQNLGIVKSEAIKSTISEWVCQVLREMKSQNSASLATIRVCWNNCVFEKEKVTLKPLKDSYRTLIKFNVLTSRSKFNMIFYLLCKIYTLLNHNSICTQREIYYQLKNHLTSQIQIRDSMNIISNVLKIEPWYLPIVSTAKGLVYGNLRIIYSEEVVHCNSSEGILIPNNVLKIQRFDTDAKFILLVEKDAIFKKLLDEKVFNKLYKPFILITGKGYPDINTRLFLKKLWTCLHIPILVLVDADPYGIDIMLTYRFGSLKLCHISEELAIPNLRWIGIHPSEIISLNITHTPLNDRDRNRIKNILKRSYANQYQWLQKELNILLENNFKAEIEGVIKSNNYLTDFYLINKVCSQDYF